MRADVRSLRSVGCGGLVRTWDPDRLLCWSPPHLQADTELLQHSPHTPVIRSMTSQTCRLVWRSALVAEVPVVLATGARLDAELMDFSHGLVRQRI